MTTDTSQRVAIVGCGNIGSRLLQSLARIDNGTPLAVDAFEPVPQARDLAGQRFVEALDGRSHRLRFVHSIGEMQGPYGFGIVATDARHRFAALTALLGQAAPARLL